MVASWQRATAVLVHEAPRLTAIARRALLDRIVRVAVQVSKASSVASAHATIHSTVSVLYFALCAFAGMQSVGLRLVGATLQYPATASQRHPGVSFYALCVRV